MFKLSLAIISPKSIYVQCLGILLSSFGEDFQRFASNVQIVLAIISCMCRGHHHLKNFNYTYPRSIYVQCLGILLSSFG